MWTPPSEHRRPIDGEIQNDVQAVVQTAPSPSTAQLLDQATEDCDMIHHLNEYEVVNDENGIQAADHVVLSAATVATSSTAELLQHASVDIDITRRLDKYEAADRAVAFAATNATLSTAELLEKALEPLDIKDLFNLRRVSRQWRDLIATSPSLQCRTFLAPAPKPDLEWHLEFSGNVFYGSCLKMPAQEIPCWKKTIVFESSRLNPLLFDLSPRLSPAIHSLSLFDTERNTTHSTRNPKKPFC